MTLWQHYDDTMTTLWRHYDNTMTTLWVYYHLYRCHFKHFRRYFKCFEHSHINFRWLSNSFENIWVMRTISEWRCLNNFQKILMGFWNWKHCLNSTVIQNVMMLVLRQFLKCLAFSWHSPNFGWSFKCFKTSWFGWFGNNLENRNCDAIERSSLISKSLESS